MEKFSWTPQEIADIPARKIKEMFAIMNQRRVTLEQITEQEKMRKDLLDKGGPGGVRMMNKNGSLERMKELGESHMYGKD